MITGPIARPLGTQLRLGRRKPSASWLLGPWGPLAVGAKTLHLLVALPLGAQLRLASPPPAAVGRQGSEQRRGGGLSAPAGVGPSTPGRLSYSFLWVLSRQPAMINLHRVILIVNGIRKGCIVKPPSWIAGEPNLKNRRGRSVATKAPDPSNQRIRQIP